jgi:hypothetical protein
MSEPMDFRILIRVSEFKISDIFRSVFPNKAHIAQPHGAGKGPDMASASLPDHM